MKRSPILIKKNVKTKVTPTCSENTNPLSAILQTGSVCFLLLFLGLCEFIYQTQCRQTGSRVRGRGMTLSTYFLPGEPQWRSEFMYFYHHWAHHFKRFFFSLLFLAFVIHSCVYLSSIYYMVPGLCKQMCCLSSYMQYHFTSIYT